jgi:hypothetical protein
MTYIQWMSWTENESKYQRRRPQPWEEKDMPKPPSSNPTTLPQRRVPTWLQKPVRKQTTLLEVDEALLNYERDRQKQNLEKLRDTLDNWGASDAFVQMTADGSRKQAVKPALDEMADWLKGEFRRLERFEYRDILVTFSQAAQCILHKFPMIPELYRNALQDTFIKSGSDSEPLYCIKWYKSESDWDIRVKEMGDTSNAALSSNAFTVTWPKGQHLRVTKHKQWSEPFNRAIEFVRFDQGIFTHELLHWCTHEDFKNYIETKFTRRSDEYNFLKEALTEWLKRYATGDPNTGGYPWEFREAVQVTEYAKISEPDVADAYLAGNHIPQTIDRLLKAKSDYAQAQTAKCERFGYDRVLKSFAEKKPTVWMKTPHKDTALTDNMFRGFREDGLTSEQVKAKTSQAWADAYLEFQKNPK